MVTTLCSVLAAVLSVMLRRRWGSEPIPPGFFALMVGATPVAVVVVVSLLRSAVLWLNRRRQ